MIRLCISPVNGFETIKYTCEEWRKIFVVDKIMELENETVSFCKVLASAQVGVLQ